MIKTTTKDEAFILIEALIALTIFTIVAAGLIIPFASSREGQRFRI